MVIGQVADLPVCIVMLQGHLVGSIDLGQVLIRPISQTKVLTVDHKSSSQKKEVETHQAHPYSIRILLVSERTRLKKN
jgi:hypothetical protein